MKLVVLICVVAIAATALSLILKRNEPMNEPSEPQASQAEPAAEQPAESVADFPSGIFDSSANSMATLGGVYHMEGTVIAWQGREGGGVSPLEVINATIHRLEFEQRTPLASNEKAKAIFALHQAAMVLEGRPIETEDGTPIVE